MLEPSAYVVAGFGKHDTNDTESPCPKVDKPSMNLLSAEIDAIIVYLQTKDGGQSTVKLPSVAQSPTAAEASKDK